MTKITVKPLLLGVAFCAVAAASHSTGYAQQALFNHSMATKGDVWAQHYASSQPWHGQYYYLQYGQPTALVVPPNAAMQQNYSWGVSQNTMTPLYHQYGYAASPSRGGPFLGTPIWPSHTDQFGVYSVRAPWGGAYDGGVGAKACVEGAGGGLGSGSHRLGNGLHGHRGHFGKNGQHCAECYSTSMQ